MYLVEDHSQWNGTAHTEAAAAESPPQLRLPGNTLTDTTPSRVFEVIADPFGLTAKIQHHRDTKVIENLAILNVEYRHV